MREAPEVCRGRAGADPAGIKAAVRSAPSPAEQAHLALLKGVKKKSGGEDGEREEGPRSYGLVQPKGGVSLMRAALPESRTAGAPELQHRGQRHRPGRDPCGQTPPAAPATQPGRLLRRKSLPPCEDGMLSLLGICQVTPASTL